MSSIKHTLRNKLRLRLHRAANKPRIVQPGDRRPDLAVTRGLLELDRHVQVAIRAEGAGRLRRDVQKHFVSGGLNHARRVVQGGADDDAGRGRIGPEGDGGALGVVADAVDPLDVGRDVLLGGVQGPIVNTGSVTSQHCPRTSNWTNHVT